MDKWYLNFGANYLDNDTIQFKAWAPKASELSVITEGKEKAQYPMQMLGDGIFEVTLSTPLPSDDYFFRINGDKKMYPDPVSRWQPSGVHGPSRIYNPNTFQWNDHHWKGIPLKDYIIYELHIGTFTPEGTFEAIIEKLPYFKELGITAIELMPVIEFPGERNWGYDGVSLYAPHHRYGSPTALKKLIDACHNNDLAVIIDVVYNHLGPEGNYLSQFGHYFTDRYKTPWGEAINFDGPESDLVRQYFVDNALYWLTEYHVDALRLDAIHAIFDFSAYHILEQMNKAFHQQASILERQAYIIAESDLNDVRIVKPLEKGGYALDAQWSDDFHHAQHSYLTKSQWQYFADFGELAHLAKAITQGFVYDGIKSKYRKKTFGSSSQNLPGEQFVICIQNHDQVGNAGQGKRLGNFVNAKQYKMASMLLFCAPNLPLIFMGQEWNATTPFLFFTSYEDKRLGELVQDGYQKEFNLEHSETFNPQNIQRFLDSKLQWAELDQSAHREMFNFYQKLIELRKQRPCLSNCRKDLTQVCFSEEEQWLILAREDPAGSKMIFIANFSEESCTLPIEFSEGQWKLQLCTSDCGKVESSFIMESTGLRNIPLPPYSADLYILNGMTKK